METVCVCLFIFGTGRRIAVRALKQNNRKMWLKVQLNVVWYPNENLLHFYKACLLQLREMCS